MERSEQIQKNKDSEKLRENKRDLRRTSFPLGKYGYFAVAISYTLNPKLHTSDVSEYGRPTILSGDMYVAVPKAAQSIKKRWGRKVQIERKMKRREELKASMPRKKKTIKEKDFNNGNN
jgi:hypothetical protein